jgi:hypothetical protein
MGRDPGDTPWVTRGTWSRGNVRLLYGSNIAGPFSLYCFGFASGQASGAAPSSASASAVCSAAIVADGRAASQALGVGWSDAVGVAVASAPTTSAGQAWSRLDFQATAFAPSTSAASAFVDIVNPTVLAAICVAWRQAGSPQDSRVAVADRVARARGDSPLAVRASFASPLDVVFRGSCCGVCA